MIIYRYEMEDGGGPYMTLSGQNRYCSMNQIDNGYKYGCATLEDLNDYFKTSKNILDGCMIKRYEVPANEIIFESRQVKFPKKYQPID